MDTLRNKIILALCLAAIGFPGCGKRSGDAPAGQKASGPAEPEAARSGPLRETAVSTAAAPGAVFPAECESVSAVLRDVPAGTAARSLGDFDVPGGRALKGCVFKFQGSFGAVAGAPRPEERIAGALEGLGLTRDSRYDADGPDGTSFVLRRDAVLCLVRAGWDGGDDSDPDYKPSDKYELFVGCAAQ